MSQQTDRKKIVIMGAAGRDFHNFNVVYRNDPDSEVVAFTAAQIPDIAGKRYPPSLAGRFIPKAFLSSMKSNWQTYAENNTSTK